MFLNSLVIPPNLLLSMFPTVTLISKSLPSFGAQHAILCLLRKTQDPAILTWIGAGLFTCLNPHLTRVLPEEPQILNVKINIRAGAEGKTVTGSWLLQQDRTGENIRSCQDELKTVYWKIWRRFSRGYSLWQYTQTVYMVWSFRKIWGDLELNFS